VSETTEPVYTRAPGVVWRLGPDRVLVRRVDVADGQPRELQGSAALVWISLDEPGTRTQVVDRIGGAGLETEPDDGIRLLLDEQLIVADSAS
jgi:hypothetical protein